MWSADIFLDRIEPDGVVVATNNDKDIQIGTIFSEVVKVRVDLNMESSIRVVTELWSTKVNLRLTDATIFQKHVEVVPRGWSAGIILEGEGLELVLDALKEKDKTEFIHLRAKK